MVYLAWLVLLLSPYWLGPLVVWLTQKIGTRPFEPFTPGRHVVPEDVAASFRQTCDALGSEGFRMVADLFQTGRMKHVSTRVALFENPGAGELALAIALFTAARPARLVASYAELPTSRFRPLSPPRSARSSDSRAGWRPRWSARTRLATPVSPRASRWTFRRRGRSAS